MIQVIRILKNFGYPINKTDKYMGITYFLEHQLLKAKKLRRVARTADYLHMRTRTGINLVESMMAIGIVNILTMVALLTSCLPRPPTAAQKFITTFHRQAGWFNILIDEVHAPHWKVSYGYSDDCPREERNNGVALTAAVTKTFHTWLQPLRDYTPKPIVKDFRYQLAVDPLQADADLWIIFHCNDRNSTAHTGGKIPGINLRSGTKVNQNFMASLVHEMGHLFGLSDTYIPWADRHKAGLSQGGLAGTRGTQPASAMSLRLFRPVEAAHDLVPLDGLAPLGVDDINGIVWLYKHVHERLPLEDCFFPEYELEETPRGCRPKYPLIFEIKQGNEYYALKVIEEDKNLDLNAQDKDGLTALHHAVLHQFEELVTTLIAQEKLKPFLKNKDGHTPLELANELKLERIAALIAAHPKALPVTAKDKQVTSWGEIKKIK